MLGLFIVVVVLAVALVLAWNLVPAFRERMKGWSTILEAILATGVYWFGQVSDGLVEAQKAGYLPSQWLGYLPYLIAAWMIIKRFQTTSPVAKK